MINETMNWLNTQPGFVTNQSALVSNACSLLGCVSEILEDLLDLIFRPKGVREQRELEAAGFSNWKIYFLDDPPYTKYYWNEKTNESSWASPIEAAKEKKVKEEESMRQRQREILIAKVLPLRLLINRETYTSPNIPNCEICTEQNRNSIAHVYCSLCATNGQYFCNTCCDEIHSNLLKLVHVEKGFHFSQGYGCREFPCLKYA